MNDELSNALRAMSRDQLHDLWLRATAGDPLDSEEATLVKMMREHTEYDNVWERLEELNESEIVVNGVNPILHVSMRSVIETQLEQNTPPEVRKALKGFLKRGASRHEAIHAIAYEFNMELFPALKQSRPFDHNAYKRRLENIARGRK